MPIHRAPYARSSKQSACRFTSRVLITGLAKAAEVSHGAPTAAQIWGVSQQEYLDKADAWPLNPNGELLLGLKLEGIHALANAEENLKVPGIAFAVRSRRHGFVVGACAVPVMWPRPIPE